MLIEEDERKDEVGGLAFCSSCMSRSRPMLHIEWLLATASYSVDWMVRQDSVKCKAHLGLVFWRHETIPKGMTSAGGSPLLKTKHSQCFDTIHEVFYYSMTDSDRYQDEERFALAAGNDKYDGCGSRSL
jgi:hypothetical protein